ncbi:MAG: hypothetical protein RDV41_09065, partial [Planctomycetota bacterium]|nr:hypothetical protein [Planctomycetota bacterium]
MYKLFEPWREQVNEMVRNAVEWHLINNKLVDIRNKCCDFLDVCLFELASRLKHEKTIKGKLRSTTPILQRSYGKPCQICGERRVYNICHVIPLEEGGPRGTGNVVFLCPTHHFLFDHARLSKQEFDKIDKSGLHVEAV